MQAALDLRGARPSWGAGLIRVILRRQFPHQSLPVVCTLQRWWERAGSPRTGRAATCGREPTGARPHEVWQMDAAEQVPLQTGWRVPGCGSPTSVAAECSGPTSSPQGHLNEVPPREVQQRLRRAFTRGGRPERLRIDNGAPWGSAGDPTDLALWLIGLGVAMDWNPPRPPQATA